eukprot:GHVU01075356.1.p1 GENE.GHVU01075356.1~~GHVU01075356.1.p1  ORF type:complete len:103 (+),score=1.22 GHVU01075356.1:469-777(+)
MVQVSLQNIFYKTILGQPGHRHIHVHVYRKADIGHWFRLCKKSNHISIDHNIIIAYIYSCYAVLEFVSYDVIYDIQCKDSLDNSSLSSEVCVQKVYPNVVNV